MVHETFLINSLITRFLEKFHIPEWFLKVLENSGTVTVGYDHLIIYRGVSEGGGGRGGRIECATSDGSVPHYILYMYLHCYLPPNFWKSLTTLQGMR